MTFMDFIAQFVTGGNLALVGAALAVILSGIGSSKGVGMVSEAANGLVSEDPSKSGKALVLQALPATQGIYGLITAFIMIFKFELLSGGAVIQNLTLAQGGYYFASCLPIAFVGYVSAVKQARVCVTGISLIGKRPDQLGKAITSAALVETYAIFAVLVSLLMIASGTV